jgi:2-dehydro-3-deoxyphosphogluconate aldolase/(4S)-4-hydroxy-2-oxoglutarate aldolase
MTKQQALERVLDVGLVPVVRVSSPERAIAAADCIRLGGVPIVEITMTTPGAIDVIAELSRSMQGQMLVGAGTVLDSETARQCMNAGAEFIVSPVLDPGIVKLVKDEGKVMMAGALTPTEVVAAWTAGSDLVKVFPCGNVGGPQYIRALKGPLPHIPLIPTGGVNLKTAADFIRAGAAAIGIGSDLVPDREIETSALVSAVRKYAEIVRDARRPDESIVTSGSTKN